MPSENHTSEAWVERLRPAEDVVVVHLLLADGSRAQVPLDALEAEWLELAPGQIVELRRDCGGLPGHPGLALVG